MNVLIINYNLLNIKVDYVVRHESSHYRRYLGGQIITPTGGVKFCRYLGAPNGPASFSHFGRCELLNLRNAKRGEDEF